MAVRIDPKKITRVHVSTTDGVGGELKLHYANLTVMSKIIILIRKISVKYNTFFE